MDTREKWAKNNFVFVFQKVAFWLEKENLIYESLLMSQ